MATPKAPSRIVTVTLPNPSPLSGLGPGAWVDVSQLIDLMFIVTGTFSATFAIEHSPDQIVPAVPAATDLNGTSNFTAPGSLGFVVPCPIFARVNYSVYVSGAPLVQLQGARRGKQSS